MLDVATARQRLAASAEAIRSIVSVLDDSEATHRPAANRWSVHEVLCHLLHEETLDFRCRLNLTLHDPKSDWPGIDPDATVREQLHKRGWRDTLAAFLDERTRSIEWLHEQADADLEREHSHPRFGSISAATLLHSWVGHDLLHLRQILQLTWDRLGAAAQPHTTAYAGEW